MEYELRDITINGAFYNNNDGTGEQEVFITTGIVGDIYGFIKRDVIIITLDTNKTIDENKTILYNKGKLY